MTAPLLLYRMVRDYIKMNEITNKILYFPLNLFFNLKFLMRLLRLRLIHIYQIYYFRYYVYLENN